LRLIEIQTFLVFFFASLPPHSAVEAHFSSQVLYSVITGPSDLFLLIYVAARSLRRGPPPDTHTRRITYLGFTSSAPQSEPEPITPVNSGV
jgi:hypothetical protein